MQGNAKLCARRVFFMHVPKTGGVSVSTFLQSIFRPAEICPPPTGDGRWRHRPSEVAHFRLFSGHFSTDFIDALDPAGFKLTVLRHPRERVVSIYDFWRSIRSEWSAQLAEIDEDAPSFAKQTSFSEFLISDKPWVQEGIANATARQLLGTNYDSFAHNERLAAGVAFERLRCFDWFSTTNTLSADFPILAASLGVPPPAPKHKHLNSTYTPRADEIRLPVERTMPTKADLSRIDQNNRIDEALYRMALRTTKQRSHFGKFFREMLASASRFVRS